MKGKRKCEFCGKFFKGLHSHQRGCLGKEEFEEKAQTGAYVVEVGETKKPFITGGGKIALWFRGKMNSKQWLAYIKKRKIEEPKNAKNLLKFEKKHKIRFFYDMDKDKLSVQLQENTQRSKNG